MKSSNIYRSHFVFRREREVGDIINASTDFIRFYGQHFYKAILFLVAPFGIIAGIASGVLSAELPGLAGLLGKGDKIWSIIFSVPYLTTLAGSLLEVIMSMVVGYAFLKLCMQKSNSLEVGTIWNHAKPLFWKSFKLSVLLGLIIFVLIAAISLLLALFVSFSSVFMIIILSLLLIVGLVYITVSSALAYPIGMLHEQSSFKSIEQSFSLVRRHWWQTFLVVLVIYMILYFINIALSLPLLAVQWFVTINTAQGETPDFLSKALLVLTNTIGVASASFVKPMAYIALTLHYFSLKEKEEHVGLKERIALFGTDTTAAAPTDDEEQ